MVEEEDKYIDISITLCNLLQVSATKQFSLERAPITLCIQLKRFSMMGNKLTKQITFKPRIDLSRFAARHSHPAAAAQPFSYRLVSMVTHLGVSQHCGHYTAIGLTEAGSYYNFDDSYVRPIAMQSVCNTNAYIMFYELDVANTHTPPKVNGLRLSNGQQHSPAAAAAAITSASIAATATSTAASSAASATASASAVSPRFIGPQLPNGYANGGHTLGSGASSAVAKTAIQFKTTPQKTPQQNGLLLGSSGSKHSVAGAVPKGEAAATATVTAANVNKSSCNNNNNNLNSVKKQQHQQQRILPMSSDEDEDDDEEDEEEEESDEDHKVTPQLPSMPKMFEESSDSVAQTAKLKPKTPPLMKSLVPYESASEEEEQPQQLPASNPPAQLAANPRKRRSGADSSDDSDEEAAPPTPSLRNGHAKTNGSLPSSSSKASLKSASNASSAHVNSSKQKTDAIDEIFKSLTYKNKSKYRNTTTTINNNDDDDDEEKEKEQVEKHKQQKQHQKMGTKSSSSSALSNGSWQSQNGGKSAPSSPKTPPSPAVIKSKTGIWQVTRTDEDDDDNDEADDDDDDDDDVDDEVVVVEEPPKNHKNPFAASAATEANGAKRQKLLNGNAKTPLATPRIGNGYQSESVGNGAVVSELLKQSHRGYGTSVLTWSGKTSELDKEVSVSALFALPLSVFLYARFL